MAAKDIDQIFWEAAQLTTPEERQAYLDQACAGSPELRCRVEQLLQAQSKAEQFLAFPVTAPILTVDEPLREQAGSTIGPYKLLEQIGEGGMGLVFVAEQQQPVRRKVAVKIVKPGMDSRQIIARFEAERQALALMDHQNIARVLDAGATSTGRPYFAMELVRGVPITDYCDQNRLPVRERLELFAAVCRAVQHAHTKGIIHRDIKPSNVLVEAHDGAPVAKVIDFGIAKALGQSLTDKTLHTGFAQLVGTPLYMSPEQAALSGLDVDTRSDIYSLGVLLYELLTGTTPFDQKRLQEVGLDELRRIIREEEPPRPSSRISTLAEAATVVAGRRQSDPRRLSLLFRGELDWIVLKALDKDRARRYETASAFAADVEHYLRDEPVAAFPPSAWHRWSKFARRHRGGLAIAATMLVALLVLVVGGTTAALWYEQDQSQRAGRQAIRELGIEDSLRQGREISDQLHKKLATPGGVFLLLDRPAEWQQQIESAKFALLRAADLEAGAEGPVAAELRRDLEVLQERLEADEADRRLALQLEKIREDRSVIVDGKIHDLGCLKAYEEAFQKMGLSAQPGREGEDAQMIRRSRVKEQLLAALDNWAFVAWGRGQQTLAARLLQVARRADPDRWRDRLRDLATWTKPQTTKALADQLLTQKTAWDQLSPQMLDLVGMLLDAAQGDAEGWLRRAQARHPQDFWLSLNLANVLLKAKRGEAAGYYRVALAVRPQSGAAWTGLGNALADQPDLKGAVAAFQKAVAIDPQDAQVWYNLGVVLHAQKDLTGAVDAYRKALKIDPQCAKAWTNLGVVLDAQEDLTAAVDAYRKALKIDPQCAKAWYNLGHALHDQKDLKGAATAYKKAVTINSQFVKAWNNLGIALTEQKDWKGAVAAFQKAVAIDPQLGPAWNNLGNALAEQKDWKGAVAAFQKAVAIDPQDAQAWYNLGVALHAQKDLKGAVIAWQKAVAIEPQNAKAWSNLGAALAHQHNLKGAVTAFQKAVAIDPQDAKVWYNLGNALAAQKDWKGAVAALQKAVAVAPHMVEAQGGLGKVLLAQGDFAEANQATERALALLPEGHPLRALAQKQRQQCRQALQQEQRALDLVQGKATPANPVELLKAAQFCRHYHRPYTAAHLYAAAFAVQPDLAASLTTGHNTQAARAAALAVAGQGLDTAKLAHDDKTELRRQALDWLRADLKLCTQALARYHEGGKEADHKPVSPLEKLSGASPQSRLRAWLRAWDRLTAWFNDPALAGLREEKELAQLPTIEQADWRQFWTEARTLEKQTRGCFTERQQKGNLTAQHKEQVHEVQLQAGKSYAFDLKSTAFDPFLRLDDAQGRKLAENDDIEPGVILNSRIVFSPKVSGTYRLVASSFQGQGTGTYTLLIREFTRK
jgi:tetratricopeptide (TPR) repeat protein/serine/threonine protein kinase